MNKIIPPSLLMSSKAEFDYSGFADYLQLKDTRQVTIDRHVRTLKQIARSIGTFSFDSIRNYINNSKLAGKSGQSLNQVISTIRMYAVFIEADPKLYKYPLFPRKQNVVRRTLPDDKIEAFLKVPQRKYQTTNGWRMWNVFWALIAFLALRPSEAKQLTKADIDLLNKQVILRPEITKTNQFDTLPLYPNILPVIEEYLKDRPEGYLFPSEKGSGFLSQAGWSDDFHHRLKYIGVQKVSGLVPYSLRHSCATRWIANDMSLYKVRRLMRHVKMDQTLVYEHMTSGHLVNSVMKYDPLVRKHSNPTEVLKSAEENLDNFGIYNDTRYSEAFKKKLKDLFFEEGQRLIIAQE